MNILSFIRNFDIVYWIVRIVVVLLCISVHEAAHGFIAYKLGDNTAKWMGRISINPMRHLDPVGALCMLFFGFGWAKPVMVNSYNFKNRKRGMALVSLAGPVSNLLLAFIGVVILKLMVVFSIPYIKILNDFVQLLILLNIGLCVFNLIPIPPLDGSKIFLSLLPNKMYYDIMRYEHLGWILLVVALSLGVLDPILSRVSFFIINMLISIVGGI